VFDQYGLKGCGGLHGPYEQVDWFARLHGVDPNQLMQQLNEAAAQSQVSFQIATDFSPTAYKVMGISGFIEVLGLTLWGYELIANMRAGKKLEKAGWPKVLPEALEISPQTKVGDVLERYPATLEIFLRHGFTPLSNPLLRKTLARAVTIEQACRREDAERFEKGGLLDAW